MNLSYFFKPWQTFSTRDIITNIAGVDFFQYPLTWRWRRWGWWGWPWCPWRRTSACWTTGTPCLTKVTRWGWREHMMGRSQILPSSAKPLSSWAEWPSNQWITYTYTQNRSNKLLSALPMLYQIVMTSWYFLSLIQKQLNFFIFQHDLLFCTLYYYDVT